MTSCVCDIKSLLLEFEKKLSTDDFLNFKCRIFEMMKEKNIYDLKYETNLFIYLAHHKYKLFLLRICAVFDDVSFYPNSIDDFPELVRLVELLSDFFNCCDFCFSKILEENKQ